MADINVSAYAHGSVHKAIILKDHVGLKEILSSIPKLCKPDEIKTEAASIAEDEKAVAISNVINRRDVPNGDTPLHLAAKLGDVVATEMLMVAGTNGKLRNKEEWNASRQAIISKQKQIAMIIIKYSWNNYNEKWQRRMPRYLATMRRIRDFYMLITFHFESSVIPFISRIAPSDTYKIWKKGGNMRADMTLAGFDGLKIKRADQSILFLGDGSADGTIPPSMCLLSHKKKEVLMSSLSCELEGPTEKDVKKKLAEKSKSKVVRVGIDVSEALLVPQLTWRRKERKEMVGPWKTKVYGMENVVVTVKSQSLPGAPPAEAKSPSKESKNKDNENFDDILTDDERKQFEAAMNSSDENGHRNHVKKEKKGRSGGHREKGHHHKGKSTKAPSENSTSSSSSSSQNDENFQSEYKRGMMPILWLSPNFPLKIEELLPLLDILAEKVKAARR